MYDFLQSGYLQQCHRPPARSAAVAFPPLGPCVDPDEQAGSQGDGAVVGDTDRRGRGLPLAFRVAFAVGAARSHPGEFLCFFAIFVPVLAA